MPKRMKISTSSPQPIYARRLIIASNRGPVEYQLTHDKTLKPRRGAGGMVTALTGAGNHMKVTWVALAMTEGDRVALKSAQHNDGLLQSPLRGQNMQLRYVAIAKSAYRKHYEQISNELLWFLQHYLYDPSHNSAFTPQLLDAWNNGYRVANQAIADAVIADIERDNTSVVVMLHDYQLYLASAIIRSSHPSVVMQQFIHIPWPDVRCWQFLPNNIAYDIYSGMIGNDIIGFQTERDAHNFLEGARMMLDGAEVDIEDGTICWKGHCTRVRAYPVSISVEEERGVVNSVAGKRAAEKIKPFLREHTIMRVDRIEPTKNILRGFQAYDQMLEEHPEMHGKVTFLAFLVPSRQALRRYRRYYSEILSIIQEINEKYGSQDWTPIHAFCDNDRIRALSAMQFYDALLVNPIIDGMNLVAKEGPIVNQNHGILVLSRTAGAFQQLAKGSIPTSPTDVAETAQALYKALTLSPQERRAKATFAREAVERSNLSMWFTKQISDINKVIPLPLYQDEPVSEAMATYQDEPVVSEAMPTVPVA